VGLLAAFRTAKQREGDAAEERALRYLEQQGMQLVERNFRCKGGEIDLIVQSGPTLVFVEVRKRADTRYGGAAASITPRKQGRILLAAQVFLQRYRQPPPCRVDVVAVDGDSLRWLPNAIEA
jgi:putative endonuclease